MIYTSYFANIKNIPEDIIPISICLKSPIGYKGFSYIKLAPSKDILYEYKKNLSQRDYTKRYISEILKRLDPYKTVDDLLKLANSKNVVLICYEKPNDFCHRKIVKAWLNKYGFDCEEYM